MKPKKDTEIKARVDGWTKSAIEQIAAAQQLDSSDIIRQAVREFIDRSKRIAA